MLPQRRRAQLNSKPQGTSLGAAVLRKDSVTGSQGGCLFLAEPSWWTFSTETKNKTQKRQSDFSRRRKFLLAIGKTKQKLWVDSRTCCEAQTLRTLSAPNRLGQWTFYSSPMAPGNDVCLFKFLDLLYMYVYFACMCEFVPHVYLVLRSQKRAFDPLELELWVVVRHIQCWESNPGPLHELSVFFTTHARMLVSRMKYFSSFGGGGIGNWTEGLSQQPQSHSMAPA